MAYAPLNDDPRIVLDDEMFARQRRRVFALAAITVLIIGLLYTFIQPRVYQSTATVLMSAPTAIDEQMLDADIQGVAIQRRILTGSDITQRLAAAMQDKYGTSIDVIALRNILDVGAVPETNLVELAAADSEQSLLPPLVETWIEVYTDTRAQDIGERKNQTLTEVQGELDGLATRLTSAREALDDFRSENEIISMERQENDVLARLDGLNQALNSAIEEEVNTKAYLDTLRRSLNSGEQIVPDTQRSEVDAMAQQLAALRTRLAELRSRYTDDYILKDPRMREIPSQILELETELGKAYDNGSVAELANAERAYNTALETVRDLSARLQEHKGAVAAFNSIYATHNALVEDLARLEELNRETQARQVQIQVRQVEKYPQISVIDWPTAEAVRIGPPYLLLLGGSVIASLLAGIFGVWLFSYLNPRSQPPAYVTLSGVHMYPQDAPQALAQGAQTVALGAASAAQIAHQGDSNTTSDQRSSSESDSEPFADPELDESHTDAGTDPKNAS